MYIHATASLGPPSMGHGPPPVDVGLWLLLVFLGVFWMVEMVVSSVPPSPCGCGPVVVASASECFSEGGGGCF